MSTCDSTRTVYLWAYWKMHATKWQFRQRTRLTGKSRVNRIIFHEIEHYDGRKPGLRHTPPPVALPFDEDMLSDWRLRYQ